MKRFTSTFALVLIGTLIAGGKFGGATLVMAGPAADSEKQFLMTHREADSRFLTSIERVGPCEISSDPVSQVRVPSEIYPKESVDLGETGTVQVELAFDDFWCVRKTTIVKSTGYWRLDQASLSFLMTVRYKPDPKAITIKDGQSTLAVKLEWRRGVCGGYKKCLFIDLSPAA
jgi:outer membrane biosynthesis protein TonB